MPRSLVIETENLPPVVQSWLKAIGIGQGEEVELVFTEHELLLRRPINPQLRDWARQTVDRYDRSFRTLLGLDPDDASGERR